MPGRPSQSYTMEQFISLGKATSVTYDKYSYKDLLSNGTEIAVLNVVNDYMREFKDAAVTVNLTTDEYRKYRYKPKLLCYDVYGSQELYWVILLLNGIIDIKDFNYESLLMLTRDDMNTLMSAIYNAEYKYMDSYNADHGTR